ncbi:type II toxin-antitoxin system MqsA family antitoxin [Marimonas lutisalis]|uniref:type II toxin-antitoxin system MqsA family antitoxin n=1 Tax=Marimonas lutisalis TaxID=2545756 RepID=UPI001375E201|nr:type II toxin-antitoxin system MqsA family antitoxin [Marimonas lutisalis]
MQCSDTAQANGDPLAQGDRRQQADEQDAPRCDSCGSGHLERAHVEMAFWSGDRMVLVEGVPALICNRCGEQYTEDQTAMRLDRLRAADFRDAQQTGERRVPVFTYPKGA